MRQFASKGFRIAQLSREAKVLYTFFCLFSLAALIVTTLYYYDLVGAGIGGVKEHYTGDLRTETPPAAPTIAEPGAEDGPELELPPEESAPKKIVATMSYQKLLEVTHFHLFTVPVFLLIVAHLFLLTPLGARAKLGWIVGSSLGATAHMAGPWIVRYGGAGLAWVMPVTGVWMVGTMLVLTMYPVWAMWRGPQGVGTTPAEAD